MTKRGWKSRFIKIRKELEYSEKDDYTSARKLNSLLKKKFSENQLQEIIEGNFKH